MSDEFRVVSRSITGFNERTNAITETWILEKIASTRMIFVAAGIMEPSFDERWALDGMRLRALIERLEKAAKEL